MKNGGAKLLVGTWQQKNQKKLTRELVSKETVVLRWWGRETKNFGFINS